MVPPHRLLVWNSRRGPHLGSGHVRPHQQTGHMIAIASIRRCSSLVGRGPSTYGSRLSLRSAGMTTEETGPYAIALPVVGRGPRAEHWRREASRVRGTALSRVTRPLTPTLSPPGRGSAPSSR